MNTNKQILTWSLFFSITITLFSCVKAEKLTQEQGLYYTVKQIAAINPEGFIVIDEDGAFVVIGELVKTLSRNVVLDDMDSMAYMQKVLRNKGVIKRLRDAGAKDGSVVVIGDVEFDFVE